MVWDNALLRYSPVSPLSTAEDSGFPLISFQDPTFTQLKLVRIRHIYELFGLFAGVLLSLLHQNQLPGVRTAVPSREHIAAVRYMHVLCTGPARVDDMNEIVEHCLTGCASSSVGPVQMQTGSGSGGVGGKEIVYIVAACVLGVLMCVVASCLWVRDGRRWRNSNYKVRPP